MDKFRAIGLMSGTSIDGIDVAMIETDGFNHVKPLGHEVYPYDETFRHQLRKCFGKKEGTKDSMVLGVEKTLTQKHAEAVNAFLAREKLTPADVHMIGFHGQTLWHDPAAKETVQIGDGDMLADLTKITVVNQFRQADVRAGGQGAPLAPLYHRALAHEISKPLAIVNIGGVSNITWIAGDKDDEILAFDLGTGSALIDDWMLRHEGKPYDLNGSTARSGTADDAFIDLYMKDPYFAMQPPKSLDRDAFAHYVPVTDNVADGAATLTMMTVRSIAHGIAQTPQPPKVIYVTGGGRHNKYMMELLAKETGIEVKDVEEMGWRGDAMEAEAFAYLAARVFLHQPTTLPTTTNAPEPMVGGLIYKKH